MMSSPQGPSEGEPFALHDRWSRQAAGRFKGMRGFCSFAAADGVVAMRRLRLLIFARNHGVIPGRPAGPGLEPMNTVSIG
jgi:hypothetical protein